MSSRFFSLALSLLLIGCQNNNELKDLNAIRNRFIISITNENVDESPFQMNYSLRTIFFSKEIVSLFGEVFVYDRLPHGWTRFEGKTYYKINGHLKELALDDLFVTSDQKEFLRAYCENNLKYHNDQSNYFTGQDPLLTSLNLDLINTFVIDKHFLIIIFQPYAVGSMGDGPFVVKIPYAQLKDHWNPTNPLAFLLPKALSQKDGYTSSWNEEEFFQNLLES